jgi:hypothetical protein
MDIKKFIRPGKAHPQPVAEATSEQATRAEPTASTEIVQTGGRLSPDYFEEIGKSIIGRPGEQSAASRRGTPVPVSLPWADGNKIVLPQTKNGNLPSVLVATGEAAELLAARGNRDSLKGSASTPSGFRRVTPAQARQILGDPGLTSMSNQSQSSNILPSAANVAPDRRNLITKKRVAIFALSLAGIFAAAKYTPASEWMEGTIGSKPNADQSLVVARGAFGNGEMLLPLKDKDIISVALLGREATSWDLSASSSFRGVKDEAGTALTTDVTAKVAVMATADVDGKKSAVTEKDGRTTIDLERVSLGVLPADNTCGAGTYTTPTFFGDGKTPPKYDEKILKEMQTSGALPSKIGDKKPTTVELSQYIIDQYNKYSLAMCYQVVGDSLGQMVKKDEFINLVQMALIEAWGLDESKTTFANQDAVGSIANSVKEAYLKDRSDKDDTKVVVVDPTSEHNRVEIGSATSTTKQGVN